jgi:hypothetical protein
MDLNSVLNALASIVFLLAPVPTEKCKSQLFQVNKPNFVLDSKACGLQMVLQKGDIFVPLSVFETLAKPKKIFVYIFKGNSKVDEYDCWLLQSANGLKEVILDCSKNGQTKKLKFALKMIDNYEVMHFKWFEDPKII